MRSHALDLLNPTTRAIVRAAEERGIPWMPLYRPNLIQLGYGKHRRLIQGSRTDRTSLIGGDLAQDKRFAKRVLQRAGLPCPEGAAAKSREEALSVFRKLGAPVAVKPVDGHQGQGISIGVETEEALVVAFDHACAFSEMKQALIEQVFRGRDYRVLVVGGRFIAACERSPAQVEGDGKSTVSELIERENETPLRGAGHGYALSKLQVGKKGIDLSSVPAEGERVVLCDTANLSTGGTARDVTEEVHPSIRAICESAAFRMDLDVCGIDLIMADIARPIQAGEPCGIIELNTRPGLRMHEHPSRGDPRPAGRAIVELLFPPGASFRVPIIGVAESADASSMIQRVREKLERSGKRVGNDLADATADIVILPMKELPPEGADLLVRVPAPGRTHLEDMASMLAEKAFQLC